MVAGSAGGERVDGHGAGNGAQGDGRAGTEVDAAAGDDHGHAEGADADDHGLGDDGLGIPAGKEGTKVVRLEGVDESREQAEDEEQTDEREQQ